MQQQRVDKERQLVVFSLYQEEFGCEITQVREIIKLPSITKLPHVSDYIKGVTNIRGEIIPVISLRKRFGLEEEEETQNTRVIIVEINGSQVGFVVDSVAEVLRIPESAIEPPPRSIAGLKADYLNGVGKVDDRLLILLDVNKILTTEEQIQLKNIEDYAKEAASTEEIS
ncbi:MAG: chemotaxis protein CheW [Firmicutes bacterium]|nr:chemotaxis protein CheW [Bacillota bacterium]